MSKSNFRGALVGAIAAAGLVLGVLSADAGADDAKIVILWSQSGAYSKGQLLQGQEVLTLDEGDRVRLMTPSGATRDLPGPVSAEVESLDGALDPMSEGFVRIVAYLAGESRDSSRTLATRSDAVFYISGVAYSEAGGVYCYRSGDELTIDRRNASSDVSVRVSSRSGVVEAVMPAGEASMAWPAGGVRSGESYVVALTPGNSATVKLVRLRGAAPSDEMKEAVYAENGCHAQLDLVLDQLG